MDTLNAVESMPMNNLFLSKFASISKEGRLEPDIGMLSSYSRDFMMSTIYRLMLPMTVFKILQRQLTSVDLRVDEVVNARYSIAKVLYFSFSNAKPLSVYQKGIAYLPYPDEYKRKISTAEIDNTLANVDSPGTSLSRLDSD